MTGMTKTPSFDADVIISGGGPVGLGLAIELGRRGVSALVVERHSEPLPIPRGQNLTQRTMEHFHVWGAEPQIRAARTIPESYGIGGLTAYGTLLGPYHYNWLQRELVRPFYFKDNERLPQYATEAVLRARVSEMTEINVIYGWDVRAATQTGDGVSVTIAERGGGGKVLNAAYLVGCDGARSVVRDQAGLTQTRSDHDRLMVLLVFRSPELHELLKRYPGKSFFNVLHPDLEGYWRFFGRVDLGATWFFHAPVPPGTTRDNFDFAALVREAVGADFALEIEHIGFWDLRFAVADDYRKGRMFIAGDAAHSHPPYGGYGINTGFEDARNLGWKLAAVRQGWGGADLLNSYSAERQPVFASTARDFIEKSIADDRDFLKAYDPARDRAAFEAHWTARGSGAKSEVQSFEPNYEGSAVVFGPPGGVCGAVGAHDFAARPGHHLAPRPLSSGHNVFDELGDGFTLLEFGGDDGRAAAFEDAARTLNIPLKIIRDSAAEGREAYTASAVLVRPDHFVAWTSNEAPHQPAAAVLQKVTGRL